MIFNKNSSKNQGFSAMQAIIAVGVIAVVALIIFGLPSGLKGFFAKLKGSNTASISAFGNFQKDASNNVSIDSVADTVVKDLMAVRDLAKAEAADKKDGICFKNPASADDFYNIVSNISATDACDSNTSIVNVISLPTGVSFADPNAGANKSVVFQKDGTAASSKDILIKISSSAGVRLITITPSGSATYTVVSNNATGSTKTNTVVVTTPNTSQINALGNIANGISNLLGSLRQSDGANVSVAVSSEAAPSAPGSLYGQGSNGYVALNWAAPVTAGTINGTPSAISTYKIYRSFLPNQETFITSVGVINYFTDYTVSGGSSYYYKVTAVNAAGLESPFSNEVYATASGAAASIGQAPVIYYPNSANAQIFQPSAPLSVSAVFNGGNVVTLNWAAPYTAGNSYISGYKVYRSVYPGSLTMIYDSNSLNTSYTDSGVAMNTTYCYEISAKNPQFEGPQSNQQCVYTGAVNSGTPYYQNQQPYYTNPSVYYYSVQNQQPSNNYVPTYGSTYYYPVYTPPTNNTYVPPVTQPTIYYIINNPNTSAPSTGSTSTGSTYYPVRSGGIGSTSTGSTGSTSTGSTYYPVTSGGSTSTGSTYYPVSSGSNASTSTGSTYYPVSSIGTTSTGSTSTGSTYYPVTSGTATSTGSTYYPVAAPSTSTGTTYAPVTTGSTSTGSTYYPVASAGSTSTGSTYSAVTAPSTTASTGTTYYPVSSGSTSTGTTYYSTSTGSASTGTTYYPVK